MRHPAMFCLLLALVCQARGTLGQSAAPFSEFEIAGTGVLIRASEPLASSWAPGPGAGLRVETPFYLGFVSGTLVVAPVGARPGTDVPSYLSIMVTGGWAATLRLPGGVRVLPGFRTGIYGMRFDDPAASFSGAHESELVAGLDLRVRVSLGNGWHAAGSASQLRVFTYHPIDLRMIEVGVSRAIYTPRWLREVLE